MPVTINGTTGITTPNLINGSSLNFRNKIINGNFDIWQRGTSLGSGTADRYLADRFFNNSIGSTYTLSQQLFAVGQVDVPNNPSYFHRTVVSSVAGNGNYAIVGTKIESVKNLAGKTATLSFYAKADSAKPISIEFVQNFGTGGSPSSSVYGIGVQKLNLTSSWQKFTVTANIPSIAGKTIGTNNNDTIILGLYFDAGSDFNSRTNSLGQQSGTFDIAQVQLEEGSVATPFELRPIGTELALCQRYYEKSYNIDVAPGTITTDGDFYSGWISGSIGPGKPGVATTTFRVSKRTAPTIILYSSGTGSAGKMARWDTGADVAGSAVKISTESFYSSYGGATTTISNAPFGYQYTADAEL